MLTRTQAVDWSGQAGADRRQWGRFVADVGHVRVEVRATDVRDAEVLDESFGGVGLLMEDVSRLDVGDQLRLTYDGAPMGGVIRSVRLLDDGRYRVGLQWQGDVHQEGATAAARMDGCLVVLFHMWQAGRRDELVRTVIQLKDQAEQQRLERLAARADALLDALAAGPPVDVVGPLTDLVDTYVATPA